MGRSIVFASSEQPSGEALTGDRTRGGLPDADEIEAKPAESPDGYGDQILKLIPAEVVALYLAMDGVIASNEDINALTTWGVFLVGLVATWFYLARFMKVEKRAQVVVSVIAFGVWALATGNGFRAADWYEPSYAVLAMLAFTFFAPKLVSPRKPSSG